MSKVNSLILSYDDSFGSFVLTYKEKKSKQIVKFDNITDDFELLSHISHHFKLEINKAKTKAVTSDRLINQLKNNKIIYGFVDNYKFTDVREITSTLMITEKQNNLKESQENPIYKTMFTTDNLAESLIEFFNTSNLYLKKLYKQLEQSQDNEKTLTK